MAGISGHDTGRAGKIKTEIGKRDMKPDTVEIVPSSSVSIAISPADTEKPQNSTFMRDSYPQTEAIRVEDDFVIVDTSS